MLPIKNSRQNRVFLSHATPEDNEFTRWLAAKLSIAGYDVWCDFDELKGGDIHWDKIETTIRHDTYRLIAIVSPASYLKDGVKKEWALAATIEKQRPGFIIPVRIGNFDFNDLPIHIHQKNAIDFDAGWHIGLGQVLDTLDTAGTPKNVTNDPSDAIGILKQGQSFSVTLVDQQETLESNWLEIKELPSAIEVSRILSSQRQIKLTEKNRALPWFEIEDRIVGFARRDDMAAIFREEVPLKAAEAYITENFLSGDVSFQMRVEPRDAQNRVTYLVRQAWDIFSESKGLLPYQMASGAIAWYVPLGLLPKEKVEFLDVDGKKRRRQLAGSSEKYKVNWHYGISAFPLLGQPWHMELHSHVIFTNNEGSIVDTSRMHRLRRGFCKSWWNDRWRGFLRAYLAHLAGGKDIILLPVGSERFICIDALPMRFTSPIGLSDIAPIAEDEEVQLEELEADFTALGDDEEESIE